VKVAGAGADAKASSSSSSSGSDSYLAVLLVRLPEGLQPGSVAVSSSSTALQVTYTQDCAGSSNDSCGKSRKPDPAPVDAAGVRHFSETVCLPGGLVWADPDAAGTSSDVAADSGADAAASEAAGRRGQKQSKVVEEAAAAAASREASDRSNCDQGVRATRGSRAANASGRHGVNVENDSKALVTSAGPLAGAAQQGGVCSDVGPGSSAGGTVALLQVAGGGAGSGRLMVLGRCCRV
jgi:hypothetical protein